MLSNFPIKPPFVSAGCSDRKTFTANHLDMFASAVGLLPAPAPFQGRFPLLSQFQPPYPLSYWKLWSVGIVHYSNDNFRLRSHHYTDHVEPIGRVNTKSYSLYMCTNFWLVIQRPETSHRDQSVNWERNRCPTRTITPTSWLEESIQIKVSKQIGCDWEFTFLSFFRTSSLSFFRTSSLDTSSLLFPFCSFPSRQSIR